MPHAACGLKAWTGAAVSAVMRDAGLTHGGFYKHFESKDELLMESVSEAFKDIGDRLVEAAEKAKPKGGVESDCEDLPEPGVFATMSSTDARCRLLRRSWPEQTKQ